MVGLLAIRNPQSAIKAVVDFNSFSGHYHQPLFPVAIINA
jgi:hypothetical protein